MVKQPWYGVLTDLRGSRSILVLLSATVALFFFKKKLTYAMLLPKLVV
jgi:hypothetical protein